MSQLMHPRVAHNYAKQGYYPTDDGTLRGIDHLLARSEQPLKFLDPCCGCGDALVYLARGERFPFATCYGIEDDVERAALARQKIRQLLQGDALDSKVTTGAADVLFLNPPYGWSLRDSEAGEKSEKLEHRFLRHFYPALHAGGLLIYIVPEYSVDKDCLGWLQARFEDIGVWAAATDRFKQIVIVAKKRAMPGAADKALRTRFERWQSGEEAWPVLPDQPLDRYVTSDNNKALHMQVTDLDVAGVTAVLAEYGGLWQDFNTRFGVSDSGMAIRPVHDLTDWHTSLLIASGIVSGLVDNGRQRLLVKGRTVKMKTVRKREDENGEIVAEEHRDRFETVIKAIDLTPGAPTYGDILIIK